MTTYEFRDGDPYTNYLVSVDGIVDVGPDSARVVALAEATLTTAEGVPSIPRNLGHVGDVDITTISLEWDEPLTPNGVISGYQIQGKMQMMMMMMMIVMVRMVMMMMSAQSDQVTVENTLSSSALLWGRSGIYFTTSKSASAAAVTRCGSY
jgi:hypothetical protein